MSDKKRIETIFDRLWPLCRSLAGPGYRDSLAILSETVPFELLNVRSGTRAFDWTVPDEWEPREAYFIGPDGRKHADFSKNNLHLVSYSVPFKGKLPLRELKKHLYSRPELPDAVPYVTSYYERRWGFCLPHKELSALPDGEYRVHIDTSLKPGRLVIGETVLPGRTKKEIFFSTYLCHPSMANNELSGPLAMLLLYEKVRAMKDRRYTYRFVVAPETIGAICYLKKRGEHLKKTMQAGYVMTCLAAGDLLTYKRSRQHDSLADRAAATVLKNKKSEILPFDPAFGSDERQYCSPGFDLPVGSLMRGMYTNFQEYHTSLDDKDFVSFDSLLDSAGTYFDIVRKIESYPDEKSTRKTPAVRPAAGAVWVNTSPYGEPQLGRHGLYPTLGGKYEPNKKRTAQMWLLNLSDGRHDLFSIAKSSRQPVELLQEVAGELEAAGLLRKMAQKGKENEQDRP